MRVPFFAFDKRQIEFHLKNCAPVISSNTFLLDRNTIEKLSSMYVIKLSEPARQYSPAVRFLPVRKGNPVGMDTNTTTN
jgi:hypothetical protein